jgi:hypothetical protein
LMDSHTISPSQACRNLPISGAQLAVIHIDYNCFLN